ncbi:hypothetical protein BV20DRAFT_1020417 [Pilatotrama ljubarskyi]|nr:hypothetical protein BV20DRAFT_1020417 [Pilatotrama ljubarskyi]
MDRPASALRRKSQVYVEIPPSPLTSKFGVVNPRVQQEHTPLRAVAMNIDHEEPSSTSPTSNKLKRKSMDASNGTKDAVQPPKSKRPKTDAGSEGESRTTGQAGKSAKADKAAEAQESHVRCHQCTRQYDPSGGTVIQCTYMRPSGQRCVLKYCKACLRNRYQEDIDTIRASEAAGTSAETRTTHGNEVTYIFKCPRCRDACNCRFCRKAKGLPATGDLNLLARKAAKASVAQDGSEQNQGAGPKATGVEVAAKQNNAMPAPSTSKVGTAVRVKQGIVNPPKKAAVVRSKPHLSKPRPHVLVPPSPHVQKLKAASLDSTVDKQKRRMGRPKHEPAPRVAPQLAWSRLPTRLSYNGALQRLNIREFLLRFAHLTDIARGHLEELEELGSSKFGNASSDDDEESDGPELIGWISELALRAILVGLLTLISKDTNSEHEAEALATAVREVKGSGASLNKMWATLASLRDNSSLALPDPLPPATSMVRHSTRSGALAQGASGSVVAVMSAAQLVPVVDALLERTLQTKAVRDDFERAVSQEKDLARAARELTAEEKARWKTYLDAKDGSPADRKAARSAHKAALAAIEHAQKIASTECIYRFAPLGRDTDGRVYYVLTPGMIEREAALDLLEGGKGDVKLGKRRGVADEAQRKRMRHWSWLLAVWGRKPQGAEVAKLADDDEDEGEEDEDDERWWGFWQAGEISKLSQWLTIKHGIDLEAKRVSKDVQDTVAAGDEQCAGPDAQQEDKQRRGRPSNASSVAETTFSSTSRSGPRTFTSMNKESSGEEDSAASDGSGDEDEIQMQVDARGEPVPRKQDLKALVKGLQEYADLLEWRIKRASKEAKEGLPMEKTEKEKGQNVQNVQKEAAIPTQTFYGK